MGKPETKNRINAPKTAIDPQVAAFITLDDISTKLTALLHDIKDNGITLKAILKELLDEEDMGEYMFTAGTATTDLSANITDLIAMMGHPVKGYVIKNDGVNTLEVGHNITRSSIDSGIQTASARFYPLYQGEEFRKMYNRNVIRNVYLRTLAGNSAYRLWLLW